MQPFGELLAEALRRTALSQRAFAARTGTPLSTVNEVIAGRRKPPRRRIAAWAEALDLDAERRQAWERAALLAHADPALAAWIADLEAELMRCGARPRAAERPPSYDGG